jgi:hypothetical protein
MKTPSRSLLQGKTSHKFIDLSENPIMHIYYTSRPVLFFMCAGNEAFYAALYLLHFTEGPVGMYITTCTRSGSHIVKKLSKCDSIKIYVIILSMAR